jgi:ubiquinone/menaquinone biosynthesis C-methylase UbiE
MSLYADYIFPVVLDIATKPLKPQRQQTIALATGRVLEIGIGTGANLPFYSQKVSEIIGIEPELAMLKKAELMVKQAPSNALVKLAVGDAHHLEFADNSFDTVIMCLVLCTIPDPLQSLKEAHRVLKADGQLLFLEHVRAPSSWVARCQDVVNPAWKHLACGCQLNRDTETTITQVGFVFQDIQRFQHPKLISVGGSIIQGVAVKS